jgi:hypothetical protein
MLLKPSSIFIHHYRVHITIAMKFTYLHVLVYFVCTLHVVLYTCTCIQLHAMHVHVHVHVYVYACNFYRKRDFGKTEKRLLQYFLYIFLNRILKKLVILIFKRVLAVEDAQA